MSSENPELTEKCGLVGVYDFAGNNAVRRTVNLISALRTRGGDAAGIAALNKGSFHVLKDTGRAEDIFTEQVLNQHRLEGPIVVGHARWIMQGDDTSEFAHPLLARYADRKIAFIHNGNIPNLERERALLASKGVYPEPDFDSNVLAHLIASAEGENWIERTQNGLVGVHGSYSGQYLTQDRHLVAVRDPWGNRPLWLAKIENGVAVVSETVAFPKVSATNWYEIKPGEVIDISQEGILRSSLLEKAQGGQCFFERVYFGHETSLYNGEPNSRFRRRLGTTLAKNHPAPADVVSAIPESSSPATSAFAWASGIPEERLVLRTRSNVSRTFMEGEVGNRAHAVDQKFDYSSEIAGRKIALGEDSVVNGTTLGIVSDKVWAHGSTEQHVRVTAPPVIKDCDWGTNMRNKDGKFVALDEQTGEVLTNEEIAKKFGKKGVTSIEYITMDELRGAIREGGADPEQFCFECIGGKGLGQVTLKVERPGIEEFCFAKELDLEKSPALV